MQAWHSDWYIKTHVYMLFIFYRNLLNIATQFSIVWPSANVSIEHWLGATQTLMLVVVVTGSTHFHLPPTHVKRWRELESCHNKKCAVVAIPERYLIIVSYRLRLANKRRLHCWNVSSPRRRNFSCLGSTDDVGMLLKVFEAKSS